MISNNLFKILFFIEITYAYTVYFYSQSNCDNNNVYVFGNVNFITFSDSFLSNFESTPNGYVNVDFLSIEKNVGAYILDYTFSSISGSMFAYSKIRYITTNNTCVNYNSNLNGKFTFKLDENIITVFTYKITYNGNATQNCNE